MEKYEFKLIQEMADVQEYLDDIMYIEHGKDVPGRIRNNEFILIKIGELFSTMCRCPYQELDDHHDDWMGFGKLVELWRLVLRTTKLRKTYDVQKWIMGNHSTMYWVNNSNDVELYKKATYIVNFDARAKMRYLIQLTQELGYSIKDIHKRFMENEEIKRLELDAEKIAKVCLEKRESTNE